jgi:UDP-N-acetylmuramate: L-alanyl-gamma-D-glutamyl-meso-diaminopimelate ligase
VIDDFAHHPTAIRESIGALREQQPGHRVVAILEPRSNTMKQGATRAQLPGSLAGADRVYCYSGGVSWNVAETMAPLGERVSVHSDLEALVEAIAASAVEGDQLLVMSNGGFGGIHTRLLQRLGDRGRRAA